MKKVGGMIPDPLALLYQRCRVILERSGTRLEQSMCNWQFALAQ